jgi:formate-dependent phosphoribosylglycinamide formyltransferase (GAR transformylase)
VSEDLDQLLELGWDLVIGKNKNAHGYMGQIWDPNTYANCPDDEVKMHSYLVKLVEEDEKVLLVEANSPDEVIKRLYSMAQHRELTNG